jgi:hypothetical protein
MNNNEAYIKVLKPLIGGKVKHIIVDPSPYGDVYMGLVIEVGKKTYELVGLADPEGNGAGFLSVTKISDFSKKSVESAATN